MIAQNDVLFGQITISSLSIVPYHGDHARGLATEWTFLGPRRVELFFHIMPSDSGKCSFYTWELLTAIWIKVVNRVHAARK